VSDVLDALLDFATDTAKAQTMVDTYFLDTVPELIKSPHLTVRFQTCRLLANIASTGIPLVPILAGSTCTQLVSLLRRVRFPMLGTSADDHAAMTTNMSSRMQ
jgi:hypothetical protein